MRSLFVIYPGSPLPPDHGGAIRYWNLLLTLRELGPVDVWLMQEPDEERSRLLVPECSGGRVHADVPIVRPWSPRSDLIWAARGRTPRWPDFDVVDLRRRFAAWLDPPYDLVLSADALCHHMLGSQVEGTQLVDLGDVPDRTARRELVFEARQARLRVLWPRTVYHLGRGALNLRRHRRLQQRMRRAGVVALTCSRADREHLGGAAHALLVRNGYERTGAPVGHLRPSGTPTILMQGSMRYEPNADGARFFAHEILPLIRTRRGRVRFLVVGAIDEPLRAELAALEDVEVTGFLPRIEDALARADLVVAPLRLGGGTRIKILEAFANRIPVVSTTVGAEGLDLVPGRHLLVADEPPDFAGACDRVLRSPELRTSITDAAFTLVEDQYSWPVIRQDLAAALTELVAKSAPRREPA